MRCAGTVLWPGCLVLGVLAACARPVPVTSATRPALPAPTVTAGELDAKALLGEVPARAMRLGAGAPSLVASRQAVDN